MADELNIRAALSFSKNSRVLASPLFNIDVDVTGNDLIHRTQVIGSSEEILTIGEIGTIGFILFYHTGIDSSGTAQTDTISILRTTGATAHCVMQPGDVALYRVGSATVPYALASSTNSPVLEYWIVEQ